MNDIYTPEVYISEEEIARRVLSLATSITKDYANSELVVICVLKGAFIFCSDLIKKIQLPLQLEFLAVSSYGDSQVSSGRVRLEMDLTCSIEGKHVLLVEDIVDSGLTVNYLKTLLLARHPASLKLATLLYKPSNLKYDVQIDYLAFEIEDKFVIGYGLDYAGRYRELPFIGILNAGH